MPGISLDSGDGNWDIRKKVWDHMEENDLVSGTRACQNMIPNFKGSEEACQKLKDLEVFTNTSSVKVHLDRPLQEARYQVLIAEKTLYVPNPRLRYGLYSVIMRPEDDDEEKMRKASNQYALRYSSKPVDLTSDAKCSLIVIGCVAVSKSGLRLGKDEGLFSDLEFAMAAHAGLVDHNASVVAICHDDQVLDLPESVCDPIHGITVDVIVTPTQVIKCQSRPKPTGISWDKLTKESMRRISVLRHFRDTDRDKGKDVELMEVDEGAAGDNDGRGPRPARERRPRQQRNRRERRRTGGSRSSQERPRRSEDEEEGDDRPRRRTRTRLPPTHDVFVGGLSIKLRVSDFKTKVREQCEPIRFKWFGRRGFAYACFEDEGAANEAVGKLDGLEFDGKACGVELAYDKGARPSEGEGEDRPPARDRRRRRASTEDEGEEYSGAEGGSPPRQQRNNRRGPPARGRGGFRGGRGREPRGDEGGEPRRQRGDESGEPRRQRRRNRTRDNMPAVEVKNIAQGVRVSIFKQAVREKVPQCGVVWRRRGEARLMFENMEAAEAAMQALSGIAFEDQVVELKVLDPQAVNGDVSDLAEGVAGIKLGGERTDEGYTSNAAHEDTKV